MSPDASTHSAGTVFFRGSMAPRIENFTQLEAHNVAVKPSKATNAHWAVLIRHPAWGDAEVICLRNFVAPPAPLLQFDPRLMKKDRDAAALAGSWIGIRIPQINPIPDRNTLLRFLHLFMGDDGLIAVDHSAQKFWSREALNEELQHDAELDIESLFVTHAVYTENNAALATVGPKRNTYWLHTHGLAALGTLDFDILRPSKDINGPGFDIVRGIASILLDKGRAIAGQTLQAVTPHAPVHFTPVERFNRTATAADIALRDGGKDEAHNTDRVVLCDLPVRRLWGLLPGRASPSRTLSTLDSDRIVINFPNAATKRMSERAHKTFHLFHQFSEEFAPFQVKPLVKIPWLVDGDASRNEHLWFEVNQFFEDSVEATLLNNPHRIRALKAGDRRRHSLDRLTDWLLLTPAGNISPWNLLPVRIFRERGDEMLKAMAKRKKERA